MPLMPMVTTEQQQYCSGVSNTTNLTTAMSDAVSELTELIKQQESISPKPTPSTSNVSDVGTSNSDSIIGDHHDIYQGLTPMRHDFHYVEFMQVCTYKNTLIMLKNRVCHKIKI